MARQNINRGTIANDGTGDTLRTAAKKINDNFSEIYQTIGGDADVISSSITFVDSGLSFEGLTDDGFETLLTPAEPTADRTITMPDATGTLVLETLSQTLTNKTLTSPVLTTPQINDTSADHQYIVAVSELSADRTITLPLLSGDDEITFNDHTQTLTNKTLTTPVLTTPTVGGLNNGGFIDDSAGNELIEFARVASAVNHVKISNATTGNGSKIEAEGDDTNISLNLASKGTGAVDVNSKLVYNIDTVTSTTAVDLTKPLTLFNASSGLIKPTLGDGDFPGEVHYFIAKGGATVDLTGTSANIAGADSNGSFFRFQTNGTLTLLWDGDNWQTISSLDSAEGNPLPLI